MHHWSWGNHARKGNLAVINGRKFPKTKTNNMEVSRIFKKEPTFKAVEQELSRTALQQSIYRSHRISNR